MSYSKPIPVRLPVPFLVVLQRVSAQRHVPVASLIREALVDKYGKQIEDEMARFQFEP